MAASHAEVIDAEVTDQAFLSLATSSVSGDTLAANWSGVLYAPAYGSYRLLLRGPAGATLVIDGETLAVLQKDGELFASQVLAQDNHQLQVQAPLTDERVSLLWQPPGGELQIIPQWALYHTPVASHGLEGSYYGNAAWQGVPLLTRIDPILDTYFHVTPLPHPYTAQWTGVLEVPEDGNYRLGLRATDWAQLFIDDHMVVETLASGEEIPEPISLRRGIHVLRLRFKDATGHSRLHLLWQPPGQAFPQAIPSHYLWPSPHHFQDNRELY